MLINRILALLMLVSGAGVAYAADPQASQLLLERALPNQRTLKVEEIRVGKLAAEPARLSRLEVTLVESTAGTPTLVYACLIESASLTIHDAQYHQGRLALLASDRRGDVLLFAVLPPSGPLAFRIARAEWDRSAVAVPFAHDFRPTLQGGLQTDDLRVEVRDSRWPDRERTFVWRPARDWSQLERVGT